MPLRPISDGPIERKAIVFKNSPHVFCFIPKNASTKLHTYCAQNGGKLILHEQLMPTARTNFHIPLRNPLTRFWSSISEYLATAQRRNWAAEYKQYYDAPSSAHGFMRSIIDHIKNNISFLGIDQHFQSQSWFIGNMEIPNTYYFSIHDMPEYFSNLRNFHGRPMDNERINRGMQVYIDLAKQELLKELTEDELLTFYKDDVKLYEEMMSQ